MLTRLLDAMFPVSCSGSGVYMRKASVVLMLILFLGECFGQQAGQGRLPYRVA